jgi:hypothetical protein
VGGVIGIALGAVFSVVAGKTCNIEASASVKAIALAFGVSLAVGVIFGYLPANKAAKLNPSTPFATIGGNRNETFFCFAAFNNPYPILIVFPPPLPAPVRMKCCL